MAVITAVPEPNLWNEICKEATLMRPPFRDDDASSVATVREEYNASKHTPVFFGDVMHKRITVDDQLLDADFDPSLSHPACVGYAFVSKPPPATPVAPCEPPDRCQCSPREYLEYYVFPTLLPALEELLRRAKDERCFERKRTRFNAPDFLTEYLYRNNPMQHGREYVTLEEIPFVQSWWITNPRPPLPKSVMWCEEEAALVIQCYWQGYKVRAETEAQELRQWQREWREESRCCSRSMMEPLSSEETGVNPVTDEQLEAAFQAPSSCYDNNTSSADTQGGLSTAAVGDITGPEDQQTHPPAPSTIEQPCPAISSEQQPLCRSPAP